MLTDVMPTPTPVGGMWHATATVFFANDVPDGTYTLTLVGDIAPNDAVHFQHTLGNGYTDENCDFLSQPVLSLATGCQWTGSPGNTYTFTFRGSTSTGAVPASAYTIAATLSVENQPGIGSTYTTPLVIAGEAPPPPTTTQATTTTVLDKSTVIVTDVEPDPVPVGGTGTFTASVHFGNDVIDGDQVTMVVEADEADAPVSFVSLTTGAPGADCTVVPSPGATQVCSFTVALSQDYQFIATLKIDDDAIAPDGYELYATVSDFDDAAHSRWGLGDMSWLNIGPAETTTSEATTTSITVAPTSIASTTVASATTENTLPNTGSREDLRKKGFVGIALLLFGIVSLSVATVFGEYRKQ